MSESGEIKGYRIGIGGIAGKIGWIYAAAGETSEIRDCKMSVLFLQKEMWEVAYVVLV